MVTLLCFCCDHRNPAGAKFCNACGTPLHLKPCKHCEAINVRAAAHCHQCGETFALEFEFRDEAVELPEAPAAAEGSVPAEAPPEAPYSGRRRDVFTTRIIALLLTLTASALLSAYYAYRQPGSGFDAAVIVERSQPAGSGVVPVAVPADLALPRAPVSSAATADRPDRVAGQAATAVDSNANGAVPSKAKKARAESPPSHPGAKRSAQASAAKPKTEPSRRVASPNRLEPVETGPPASGRQEEPRPQTDTGPIALQQTLAVPPPAQTATADLAPRSRDSAKRPAAPIGRWDRPCAEGVALDPGCDVRTMAKGN